MIIARNKIDMQNLDEDVIGTFNESGDSDIKVIRSKLIFYTLQTLLLYRYNFLIIRSKHINVSAKSASGVEDLFIASASVGIPTAAERLEESITNSVSNTRGRTGVVSGVVILL